MKKELDPDSRIRLQFDLLGILKSKLEQKK